VVAAKILPRLSNRKTTSAERPLLVIDGRVNVDSEAKVQANSVEIGIGAKAVAMVGIGGLDLDEDGTDAGALLWRHRLLSAGEANVHDGCLVRGEESVQASVANGEVELICRRLRSTLRAQFHLSLVAM
jgi:hypothetical protein